MKKREWKQADRPWLLAVEDPQQLGRDIGSGTYNICNVQHLFAAAAATLRDCMEQQSEEQQWASVQVSLTNHYQTLNPKPLRVHTVCALLPQCQNNQQVTHGDSQHAEVALCNPLPVSRWCSRVLRGTQ